MLDITEVAALTHLLAEARGLARLQGWVPQDSRACLSDELHHRIRYLLTEGIMDSASHADIGLQRLRDWAVLNGVLTRADLESAARRHGRARCSSPPPAAFSHESLDVASTGASTGDAMKTLFDSTH